MPDFEFKKTSIEGLMEIMPRYFPDERGYFLKSFEKQEFLKRGLPVTFGEDNESLSCKGTLRGIHFQYEYPQGKLVRVSSGAVYEVAVDLRIDSPTLGKWQGFELSEENKRMLYLPEGFGSAFLALRDHTVFTYKCTDKYSREYEDGVQWDDPDLAIDWPLDKVGELIISQRDKHHQSFKEYVERVKSMRGQH